MLEHSGRTSIVERMTRLETLFEADRLEQARRDEETNRRWRELTSCVQALDARLDKFEPAILGDAAAGRKSLGERLEYVENAVLSAKVGWRLTTFVGAALLGLASLLVGLSHQVGALLGGGPPAQR